jgi:hypothetical protein
MSARLDAVDVHEAFTSTVENDRRQSKLTEDESINEHLIHHRETTFQKKASPRVTGANGTPTTMARAPSDPPSSGSSTLGRNDPPDCSPSRIRRRSQSATGLWTVRALLIAVPVVDGCEQPAEIDAGSAMAHERLRSIRDQPQKRGLTTCRPHGGRGSTRSRQCMPPCRCTPPVRPTSGMRAVETRPVSAPPR